jgi:4-oxalocrotonate tautomerase
MPHISVKIKAGTPEETKKKLSEAIVKDVVTIVGASKDSVSVAIEEVDPNAWKKEVYDPLIQGKRDVLYKKPGYSL